MANNYTPEFINDLVAYSSAKSLKQTGSLWLNANESPFTKSVEIALDNLNRYPDPQPQLVIDRYSAYANVANTQVMMTRGADEGIELLVRTFAESGKDSITLFAPTYGMYKVSAQSHNVALNVLTQSALQTEQIDTLVTQIGTSKLVFICNPNNPTGELVSLARISEIAKKLEGKAIVVVDEAYFEFSGETSATSLINEFDNLVVLRTLSKAFALAGIRTGFLMTNETLLAPLKKVLAPYPVAGVIAQLAADALSDSNIATVKRQVVILNQLKQKLSEFLEHSTLTEQVLPSYANFVTVKLVDNTLYDQALAEGIVMRAFTLYENESWLRISIGSEQELQQVQQFFSALEQ